MHHRLSQLTYRKQARAASEPSAGFFLSSRAVLLTGITLLSGCSVLAEAPGSDASESDVSQKEQAVLGGMLSERESVVLVQSQGANGISVCTGTLVAPNLVVTARHCISTFTDGDFSCTISGFLDLSRPRSPASAGDVGLPFAPANIAIHEGTVPDLDTPTSIAREVFAPETDTICRNDIAFVVLEDELDLPFETIRFDEGVVLGEPTTVVGYGLNDARRVQRTERPNVIIQAIGPSDFYSIEGNALPRTFVLGTSVCPGDSGGPSYSDETEEVLGVFSFFRGNCESSEARNFFTHIAPFKDVALKAFREAGYAHLVEPEEPPDEEPPSASGGAPRADDKTTDSREAGGCVFTPRRSDGTLHFLMWCLLSIAIRRVRGAPKRRASCPRP